MYSLHTTKALWLTSDGLRQYIRVNISQFTRNSCDMRLKPPGYPEMNCNLYSEDGFNYRNITNNAEAGLSICLRCFLNGLNVLFYGNWKEGTHEGEICIHATSKILNRNHQPDFPGLPPAA